MKLLILIRLRLKGRQPPTQQELHQRTRESSASFNQTNIYSNNNKSNLEKNKNKLSETLGGIQKKEKFETIMTAIVFR